MKTDERHIRFLWTRYVMFGIGLWLMVNPATFAQHSHAMVLNDVICGALTIILSLLSLSVSRIWAPWTLCAIGVWLQIAPLIFWAPAASGYLNDTACGAMLILFSVIIPGTPGGVEVHGGEIPPGWSYNPSSWNQRLPIVLMAFLAWMSARYMAAYQLGYIDSIWDPIFTNGTRNVVTSDLSKSFPISDAGLGAFVYTMEVLMGFKGSTRRWYTMPWIVLLFGIMVVPAGLVSILLIMLQPLIVGSWCTWCLFTAICMLIMIALTLDEMVAVCQYLVSVHKQKGPLWHIFWKGGTYPHGKLDDRSPPLNGKWRDNFAAMFWGVTAPWNLILTAILGGVLMFAPGFFRLPLLESDADHVIGALVVTISIMAMAEVFRPARLVNFLFALIVFVIAIFYLRSDFTSSLLHMIWSILLVLISIPRGKIHQTYGNWNIR